MTSTPGWRAVRRTKGRRKAPGSRRRRVLVVAGLVLAVLAGAGTWGYFSLAGKIHTFDGSGIAASRPSDSGGEDILLIGTDSRAGASGQLGGRGDKVGRSDTTILVHIYPGNSSAVAVSIPRDSLVTVPSCRLPDGNWTKPVRHTMFNSAFSVGETVAGNPACTQNTVEKLTGIHVDHTVVANFAGFAAMSDAVGGVPVCVPENIYADDLRPQMATRGRLLLKAGMQTIEGRQALEYVRVRHGLGDGSDIGRIKRQQAFLSAMVNSIRSQGLTPSHVLPLVDAATANLTFDPGLGSPTSLMSFAMGLKNISPSNIDFVTLPWRYDGPRVAIVRPAAQRLWSALRDNQPLTPAATPVGAKKKHHRRHQHKALPAAVTDGIRKASASPCSNLT